MSDLKRMELAEEFGIAPNADDVVGRILNGKTVEGAPIVPEAQDHLYLIGGGWLKLRDGVWEPNIRFSPDFSAMLNRLAEYYMEQGQEYVSEFVGSRDVDRLEARAAKLWAAKQGKEFDRDDMYLPLRKGGIDLECGRFDETVPADKLFTRRALAYAPTPSAGRFEEFVSQVMPNEEERDFLGRFCFYCLTGDISKERFLINHGVGANGKSVFWDAVCHALGDFVARPHPKVLRADPTRSSHEADIGLMAGSRLIFFEELGGRRLPEDFVKWLTSTPELTYRNPYAREHVTDRNVGKLVMNTNHIPAFDGADRGIVRRMAILDWRVVFGPEEQDPNLLEDLRSRPEEVLSWIISYAGLYFKYGVSLPASVSENTEKYALANSPITEFVRNALVVEEGAKVVASSLYHKFVELYGAEDTKTARRFYSAFERELGVQGINAPSVTGKQKEYCGIRLDA